MIVQRQGLDGLTGLDPGRLRLVQGGEHGGLDLLLTPTVQTPPPPLGALMSGEPEQLHQRQLRWFPLTPFANVSGQPAMSLPIENESGEGLPVGVQLVAELGREDVLIAVGSQLEQALPWRLVAPAAP